MDIMKTETQSRIGNSSRFKSIPDGRRVFLVSYPWTGYYVVPDKSTEHQLRRKTWWEYLLLFLSLLLIIAGVWFFKDYLGKYVTVVIPIFAFALSATIRWGLYRKELHRLQKIDYSAAVSSSFIELQKKLH